MDLSLLTDLPATAVWSQPEPATYMAQAANPTPSLAPSNGHNHPPYPEMIAAAIGALREKNGSSRQAIAKYIEKAYTDLPPNNSALLTRHLKRLKETGDLVMVKHSYMLPGSVPLLPQSAPAGNGPDAVIIPNSASGPKRRPGRPPKPKLEYQPAVGTVPVQESVFVSLGLMDEPALSAPAPVPETAMEVGWLPAAAAAPMQPQPVLGKRARGRPPRSKLLPVPMGQNGPTPMDQNAPKRGRGRPRKTGPLTTVGLYVVPRARPRPKKVGKATGRPRGRPRKFALPAAGVGMVDGEGLVAVGGGVAPAKRRGRLPKAGVVKKPRRIGAKPLGRPRKKPLITGTEAAANQQFLVHDLMKKLEHIQSKIKQVVNVVKPHLNNITAAGALGALQELEQLDVMNLSAPLNIEVQLPVPTLASVPVLAPLPISVFSQEPALVPPVALFSVLGPTSVPSEAPAPFPSPFPAPFAAQEATEQRRIFS